MISKFIIGIIAGIIAGIILAIIHLKFRKPKNSDTRFKGYEELHDEMYLKCHDCGSATRCKDVTNCPNFSMLREDQ